MKNDKGFIEYNGRPIALWGAGRKTALTLRCNPDIRLYCIIDSDLNKSGNIEGIDIVHPEDINNWKGLYVIINLKNHVDEIKNILKNKGLTEKQDFCYMDEFMVSAPLMSDIQRLLMTICFENQKETELECRVDSRQEYLALRDKSNFLRFEEYLGQYYNNRMFRGGGYEGDCSYCGKTQTMKVSYEYSTRVTPYWRETLQCPSCKMNSRMRFVFEYISNLSDGKIYIQEQVTQFYKNLKKKIPDLVGSEFLGSNFVSGEIVNGILHEDATALSFADDTFDMIGSFDVFEHIDDYMKGLEEARRCLKPGGILLLSIPVFKSRDNHVKRACLSLDGTISHLLKPQYHGNPLSENGSLVVYEFGWKIIEDMRAVGFKEVHAIVYASIRKGYFGELPVVFEAIK